MPIRSSISDPYGASVREFERFVKHGALPTTPKKPPASEREPLLEALQKIPVGKILPKSEWIAKWSNPYIKSKFHLWGIELAIYPVGRNEVHNRVICTGVFVTAITRNRKNVQPKLTLKGVFDKTWYRAILDWIDDNFYGGD